MRWKNSFISHSRRNRLTQADVAILKCICNGKEYKEEIKDIIALFEEDLKLENILY